VSKAVVYNTPEMCLHGLENGSFSYVVTNQVKVVAFGSQKLLPVTDALV